MPIQKHRHLNNRTFNRYRKNLFCVLIAASIGSMVAPIITTADAATNNWACTSVVGKAAHQKQSTAVRNAWKSWRKGAKAKCGTQCSLLKNASNKQVSVYPRGNGYGAVAKAKACYYLPGSGTTKTKGVGLRAPTRRP